MLQGSISGGPLLLKEFEESQGYDSIESLLASIAEAEDSKALVCASVCVCVCGWVGE